MGDKTSLGDRMKANYENRTKQFLTRRCPTIIRLDGKAFHTYTRGLDKPFDEGLIEDMQKTTIKLCEEIQGCVLGYTQSDEITLVLNDYSDLRTEAWFDYNIQKIVSVAASIATAEFNKLRLQRTFNDMEKLGRFSSPTLGVDNPNSMMFLRDMYEVNIKEQKLAQFDARVFQIPEKEEVVNCLIWRQQDAERNSIQMLAQSLYSHKELQNKNTSELQEMCFQKGYNWNDLEFSKKRGSLVLNRTTYRGAIVNFTSDPEVVEILDTDFVRKVWTVVNTPIFTQDRNIILDLI